MKTGIVGPFPPYRGGIAQFSARLLESLERLFPDDDFQPLSYSRLYPAILFPGTSQLEPGTEVSSGDAGLIIDSCNPFAWVHSRSFIERSGFQRLIVQWWHPFFAPSLMGSLPGGIPRASICHNVIPHESFPLSGRLARMYLERSDLVVVHSMSDLEEAQSLELDGDILRLYHPIYDQYVDPSLSKREARGKLGYPSSINLILFFGLVRPYKGVQDLVRALSQLPENTFLLIVGECYSEKREIIDIISSLGLSGRIRWIDRFVPDEEVATYFTAADIVALPYRHATQSGVAQIALSFNKIMVLTDTGGLSELVDEGSTGFLAEPWSPSSLAESIRSALVLASKKDTMERIREKAASFSWDRYAGELMKKMR